MENMNSYTVLFDKDDKNIWTKTVVAESHILAQFKGFEVFNKIASHYKKGINKVRVKSIKDN